MFSPGTISYGNGTFNFMTLENHCILIDISCVNIFKLNIYSNCALQMHQSNFYNQKLIIHPQWESNPRPPGVFTRHYKLWEWHFQLHDFRKSLHPHWHFMRQHFQIKYIYQLCIANAPILIAKGFFLKQSNFYNQKLIAHPQWESNPRPPGVFHQAL